MANEQKKSWWDRHGWWVMDSAPLWSRFALLALLILIGLLLKLIDNVRSP